MIADLAGSRLISNLGWVDHGSVWRFDSATGSAENTQLSDADYLVLGAGAGDLFTAVHHFDGSQLLITVQSIAEPEHPLATVKVRDWAPVMSGDPSVWEGQSRTHVAYLNDHATGAAGYFLVRIDDTSASLRRLDWFGDEYDLGYQSVVGAVDIPGGGVLFGVQRSSDLVLCERESLRVIRQVSLAGHAGNPLPHLLKHSDEVWAVDYDTVVRVSHRDWQVTGSFAGQEPIDGSRMFLGDLWFSPDEQQVIVPRPGSGDVLRLDTRTMSVLGRVETGGQPLQAASLSNGQVVARDWKTGSILAP